MSADQAKNLFLLSPEGCCRSRSISGIRGKALTSSMRIGGHMISRLALLAILALAVDAHDGGAQSVPAVSADLTAGAGSTSTHAGDTWFRTANAAMVSADLAVRIGGAGRTHAVRHELLVEDAGDDRRGEGAPGRAMNGAITRRRVTRSPSGSAITSVSMNRPPERLRPAPWRSD